MSRVLQKIPNEFEMPEPLEDGRRQCQCGGKYKPETVRTHRNSEKHKRWLAGDRIPFYDIVKQKPKRIYKTKVLSEEGKQKKLERDRAYYYKNKEGYIERAMARYEKIKDIYVKCPICSVEIKKISLNEHLKSGVHNTFECRACDKTIKEACRDRHLNSKPHKKHLLKLLIDETKGMSKPQVANELLIYNNEPMVEERMDELIDYLSDPFKKILSKFPI